MNSERWKLIEQLCQTALDLGPDQRRLFLDEACAGDPALRQEVESLLAFEGQIDSFMEMPPAALAAEMLAEAEAKLGAGHRVGQYEIINLLGQGGMGVVYLARDTNLGRKVALKLLPDDFTHDKKRLRRFEQEARAASALNHPNIITIYQIGEADGLHFIAAEYVEGETLRQRLKWGRLTVKEALDIAIQVAGALSAAHRANIVHRDVKPENIMLCPDGYLKVLDFGLAKLIAHPSVATGQMDDQPVKTDTGIVMGTAHYMSPEQARGGKVDTRTDLFSLGVVLYEMVTGRMPFDGETPSHVIVSILNPAEQPPPLAQFSPEAPGELQRVVSKALRKNPEERYQTPHDLKVDLESVRRELDAEDRWRAKPWLGRPTVGRLNFRKGRVSNDRAGITRPLFLILAGLIAVAVAIVAWHGLRKTSNSPIGSATQERVNVLAPFINSIMPESPMDVIGDQGVTVLGDHFKEGLKVIVTFPREGTGTLSCSQIQGLTSSSFVMLIDFNANPGQYAIQVINPDGESSNVFSFTVQHQIDNPVITSIVPALPVASKEEQSVTAYGHNFQVGLTVKVTFPNGESATLSGRQIPHRTPNSFRMLIYFNGTPGIYTMQAINPNGRASKPFRFRVR